MALEITDSDITREQLLSIPDFNEATKEKIANSDILILPVLKFRDRPDRCFYQGTSDFFKVAKKELRGYSINLCENEGEEKSLTLHSGEIWIPILLISIDPLKDVVLPTIINFVTSYIFYKLTTDAKQDKLNIHLKVIIENKKTKVTKKLSYDGPVSGLKNLKIPYDKIFE